MGHAHIKPIYGIIWGSLTVLPQNGGGHVTEFCNYVIAVTGLSIAENGWSFDFFFIYRTVYTNCLWVQRVSQQGKPKYRDICELSVPHWCCTNILNADNLEALPRMSNQCNDKIILYWVHSHFHPFIHPSIILNPFIKPSIHTCIHPSTHPSFHPSIHSSIRPLLSRLVYSWVTSAWVWKPKYERNTVYVLDDLWTSTDPFTTCDHQVHVLYVDADGALFDSAPGFFRINPACTHRLVPWLKRELGVLLNDSESHVQFIQQLVMTLINK